MGVKTRSIGETIIGILPQIRTALFLGAISIYMGVPGLLVPMASAADLTVQSGERQVSLIELFTSEGCSSCPPAEKWLGQWRKDPRLWKEVVPVAFHVDYWDKLGWPDRFARLAFTARQRQYSAAWGQSPYTPGLVVNGQEWRSYRRGKLPAPTAECGILKASAIDGSITLTFSPARDFKGGTAHASWLGMGLVTEVKRGENAGRSLRHDFVALRHVAVPLIESNNAWSAHVSDFEAPSEASALIVWVETDGRPVQAAGGWWKEP